MDVKPESDESSKNNQNIAPAQTRSTRRTMSRDDIPPVYYDSEPSSQPPKYCNVQSVTSTSQQYTSTSTTRLKDQYHRSAPAPNINAILAYPNDDFDEQRRVDRRKKTLRERWRNFKERNFGNDYVESSSDSVGRTSNQWNIQGVKVKK